MKTAYKILFSLLCIVVILSFFPWLYSIIFPSAASDPFVTFSPVSGNFVVSRTDDGQQSIFTVDSEGNPVLTGLTKNQRDSLVPQMYYNQLNARNELPDSVDGKPVDIPTMKNSQWVFSSSPRDLNRSMPEVYPIMESCPKRFELEDPEEVFVFDDGGIRFITMDNNTTDSVRSTRFSEIFKSRGFKYPLVSANANITAKKAYDEGYLLADADGKVYHLKMQVGFPYMEAIDMPSGQKARHVFILENPDTRHIGLVTTDSGNLYAIERDGYQPIRLPIDNVYPDRQHITVFKNLFNWVIKISDQEGSRWVAFDSDDYSPLGEYRLERTHSKAVRMARFIFPLRISFTSNDDCFARPRISDFSPLATIGWVVLIIVIYLIIKSNKISKK